MKWYGMANHLPSKTQKFLDSARGLAVLGRQRLDDVGHVLQVAQRLELRDEPRVGHERQVTRHAALDLGVDLGHHVTGVGLDQTVLDLRPGGVGELLDRAVERRVRRRPSTASATASPSRSPSTTPRRRAAPSEPPPAPWGVDVGVAPARGQTGRAEHPHPHPQKAAPGPQRVVLHGHSPPSSPRTAARRRRTLFVRQRVRMPVHVPRRTPRTHEAHRGLAVGEQRRPATGPRKRR